MSAGTPLGKMIIELGLDSTDFGKGLQGAKKMANYSMKEMQANMKVADMAGDKIGKFTAKQQGLTKVIEAQTQKVNQLKKSYEGSLVDGKATEQTAKYATQLQQANGQLAGYQTQLKNTVGEMARMQFETTGLSGSVNTFGKSLTTVGGHMTNVGDKMTTRVTAPIVAGVGLAVKAAMDWESAFAGVRKTNDEVVDANGKVVYSYKDLENGLRGMANELPASHKEIAATAEAAGQLGIKTENVVSFTRTMIDLGESTNMSAEEAATALARLANITQMPQTEFDKLGSTIVELGNNFATTESEITEMALRLAGAGKQVGMSEADILGFSAALSSVGIEAEAGGSAFSKVMINMQLAVEKGTGAFSELEERANGAGHTIGAVGEAVNKGGKSLDGMASSMGLTSQSLKKMYKEADSSRTSLEEFSNVAGMTGEQFSKTFKEDAPTAIIKFIEGLSKAEEHGTSAIKVLDDMGITEVRLRDSLLRAAGASGVFSGAVEMGNKAWGENTALAKEANTRYETLESQLGMLKNEATNVAIEFGGPLVGALKDGVVAAKPIIKAVSDLAKSFSDADPETQKMIMKLLLFSAAAGPVLSITGRLATSIGGMTTKTIGFLGAVAGKKEISVFTKQLLTGSKEVVNFDKASVGATKSVAGLGANAAGSAGKIGGLTTGISLLNPWILGTAAALGIGYGAWKLWGEGAYNSSQRTKRWGTDVGETTDKSLTKIQGYSQGAVGQLGLMEQGLDASSKSMVGNFEKIGKSIETEFKQKLEGLDETVKKLPDAVQSSAQQIVNKEKERINDHLKVVQENNQRIEALKKSANDSEAGMTAEQGERIRTLSMANAKQYLEVTIASKKDRESVYKAMTGDVKNATEEQATQWAVGLSKQRLNIKGEYTKAKEDLEKSLKDMGIALDSDVAKDLFKSLETGSKDATKSIEQQLAQISKKYPEVAENVMFANGQMITSSDQFADAARRANKKLIDSVKLSGKETKSNLKLIADESTVAGRAWNSLIFDEKTGKIKTNVVEVLKEASETEEGWNTIKLALKEAKLTTNAKKEVTEAFMANGKWNDLSFKDKQVLIKDNFEGFARNLLETKGEWNDIKDESVKQLLFRSNSKNEVAVALVQAGKWEKLDPTEKKLFLDSNAKQKTVEFLETSGQWEKLDFKTKKAVLEAKGKKELEQLNIELGNWNNFKAEVKKLKLSSNAKKEMSKVLIENGNWNKLSFEEKEMLLGTNVEGIARDILESKGTWDQIEDESIKKILFQSNSKEEVAKALVDAGKWNELDFSEKKLFLDSNAKQKTVEFLEASGQWNGLSLETQKAVLESEGEEEFKESILRLGLWNQLSPEVKSVMIKDEATKPVLQAIEDVGAWDQLSPVVQKAILESEGEEDLYSIMKQYGVWDKLPDSTKKIIIDNSSANSSLKTTSDVLDSFNGTELKEKSVKVEAEDAQRKIAESKLGLLDYESIGINGKNLTADNTDINNKLFDSKNNLNSYEVFNPNLKTLAANNTDVNSKTQSAKQELQIYDAVNPGQKTLTGNNADVNSKTAESKGLLVDYQAYNPSLKTLSASTNAGQISGEISGMNTKWDETQRKPAEKTFTIKTIFEKIGDFVGLEKGTNNHKGGHAIVNDQKGPLYKEFVQFPNGKGFIPQGRNVLIPNMPAGTTVLPAKKTKKLLPHYKNGVGIPSNSKLVTSLNKAQAVVSNSNSISVQTDNGEMVNELKIQNQLLLKQTDILKEVVKSIENNSGTTSPVLSDVFSIIDKENGKRTKFEMEGVLI